MASKLNGWLARAPSHEALAYLLLLGGQTAVQQAGVWAGCWLRCSVIKLHADDQADNSG